jgi:hypothetical protein
MGLVKSSSGCGAEELFTSGEEWANFNKGYGLTLNDENHGAMLMPHTGKAVGDEIHKYKFFKDLCYD